MRSISVLSVMFLLHFLLFCNDFVTSQSIYLSGTVVNGSEFVEDVVMTIKDTGDTFFAEFLLSKSEFKTKLSKGTVFVITFTKENHLQRTVIIDTGKFPDKKIIFKFDIELPELSTKIDHKLYMTPTIYFDKEVKYKY